MGDIFATLGLIGACGYLVFVWAVRAVALLIKGASHSPPRQEFPARISASPAAHGRLVAAIASGVALLVVALPPRLTPPASFVFTFLIVFCSFTINDNVGSGRAIGFGFSTAALATAAGLAGWFLLSARGQSGVR